jgi:phosphoglycerate kinase
MKTLDSIDVKGKRVLVRVDLNSTLSGNKVIDGPRFREHAKTIKELIRKGAIVVVLAHQGRPGSKDFVSLKGHAKVLNKYVKIGFVDDVIGRKALMGIEKLGMGEALLLGNVRSVKDEFAPGNNSIVKAFKGKFDFYVGDAFSIMHRRQTSIVSLPKYILSVIGRVAEMEIKSLEKIKMNLKDSVFVLGGNKPKDVILLINKGKVLTTGTLSLYGLKAKGVKLGKEDSLLRDRGIVSSVKKNLRGTFVPRDVALSVNGKRKEISVDELPSKYLIWDIGKESVKEYAKVIRNAKAIFFKGVAGLTEKKGFDYGTRELLKVIGNARGFSVVAGGSSSEAVDRFRLRGKINHVSLSGGALVYYLSGKKLPGLEVLG